MLVGSLGHVFLVIALCGVCLGSLSQDGEVAKREVAIQVSSAQQTDR